MAEVLQLCSYPGVGSPDALLASLVCGLFKWRQFEPEVILMAVGWYLRFWLSVASARVRDHVSQREADVFRVS